MTIYDRMREDRKYCVGMIGNMAIGFMKFLPDALKFYKASSFDGLTDSQKSSVMEGYLRSVDVYLSSEDIDG